MNMTDKSMEVIKLLAGSALDGARGEVALAALEIMEAIEAVQSSRLYIENPGMLDSALNGLLESGRIRIKKMLSHATLMEQAAHDLVSGNGRLYEC